MNLEKLSLKLKSVTALNKFIIKRNVGYTIDLCQKYCQKYFLHLIYYTESVKPYPYLDRPDQFNLPIFMYFSNSNSSFPTYLILSKFNQNFQTSSITFQLQPKFSNFGLNFPTSFVPVSFPTFYLKRRESSEINQNL